MSEKQLQAEYEMIATVQNAEQDALLDKENVVGIGIGHKVKGGKDTGEPCLTVFVSHKLDPALVKGDNRVPSTVGKFKTDVIESGYIFAGDQLPTKIENLEGADILYLTKYRRPARPGDSVGHYKGAGCTICAGVFDRSAFPGVPSKYYILGTNHDLARSNNASIGDPILQPSPYDGGTYPTHLIGRLSRYVPIRFDGGNNLVDAAIVECQFHDLDRDVYWIGNPVAVRSSVSIGEILQKTGRTTNYTTGKVTAINATVNVGWSGGKVAKFIYQIITTAICAAGDAGSQVLDMAKNSVGLYFAGSPTVSVMNNMAYVQALLGIRIV